jgi:hypothetical protein
VALDSKSGKMYDKWHDSHNRNRCRANEVLLTQSNKPVDKLVSASEKTVSPGAPVQIRSLKGHRVLTPIISQGELAEEMFGRK